VLDDRVTIALSLKAEFTAGLEAWAVHISKRMIGQLWMDVFAFEQMNEQD
jgi:hypothetical protein